MRFTINKDRHNGINLITQGRSFFNRIYLLTLWSSLGVPFRIIIILSRSYVVAPKVMDIKVPPAAESRRFLEENLVLHKRFR
jgi:hypothetical protein